MARRVRITLVEPVPQCLESKRCPGCVQPRCEDGGGDDNPSAQATHLSRSRTNAQPLDRAVAPHEEHGAPRIPRLRYSILDGLLGSSNRSGTTTQRKQMSTISRRLPTRWTAQHAAGGLLLVIAILLQRIVSAASGQ